MKLSEALALKPGDKIRLKSSRDKFKYHYDKKDKSLAPGEVLVVVEVDRSPYTELQVLACRNEDTRDQSWVNHASIKKVEVKDELPGIE
jgi:hypothetical protein